MFGTDDATDRGNLIQNGMVTVFTSAVPDA
jgi:hypothetical protein